VAEFPALPFFTDAYLADTRHLTTEEHGAYLLLLMCAWRTRGCSLKDDDKLLSRMAGVTSTKWKRLKPVIQDFFTISNGRWYQKKLQYVYETVSRKVERNRANGAKGGRSTADRNRASASQMPFGAADKYGPNSAQGVQSGVACFQAGWPLKDQSGGTDISASAGAPPANATAAGQAPGQVMGQVMGQATREASGQATKTKTKTKSKEAGEARGGCRPAVQPTYGKPGHVVGASEEPMAQGGTSQAAQISAAEQRGVLSEGPAIDEALKEVAAAAGLDPLYVDPSCFAAWLAAGADYRLDIVPVVRRVSARELKRTGKVPSGLAYYRRAIIDAKEGRLNAGSAGAAYSHSRTLVPKAATQFDKADPAHWRQLLGDPKNRFLGDYMSQHWHISGSHPLFMATDLGSDPRHAFNAFIPAEIYDDYGPLWRWRPMPKSASPKTASPKTASPKTAPPSTICEKARANGMQTAPSVRSGTGAIPCA